MKVLFFLLFIVASESGDVDSWTMEVDSCPAREELVELTIKANKGFPFVREAFTVHCIQAPYMVPEREA